MQTMVVDGNERNQAGKTGELRAYYIEFTDHDLALLLLDDGRNQQIVSGSPESLEEAASLLSEPPIRLKGKMEEVDYGEGTDMYRRWFKADGQGFYSRQVTGGAYDLFAKHTK